MLKKIINTLFKKSADEIKLMVRELAFTIGDENIIRAVRAIKKKLPNIKGELAIIDIGAFDGEISIKLAKEFPKCKVLAFEPNSAMFEVASEVVKGKPQITLKNIAISDANGTTTFNITANKVSSSLNPINSGNLAGSLRTELAVEKQVTVQTQTLDSLKIQEPVLLIKIDTQGHEMAVLKGATATLQNTLYVLAEMNNHAIYDQSSKYYEVDQWLREHGFSLEDIIVTYRKEGVTLTEFDALYINTLPLAAFKK